MNLENTVFGSGSSKIQVPVKKLREVLSTFTQHKNISQLAFFFKDNSLYNRNYTESEKKYLFKILSKLLPRFKKVFQVKINERNIKNIKGGPKIYKKHLQRRETIVVILEARGKLEFPDFPTHKWKNLYGLCFNSHLNTLNLVVNSRNVATMVRRIHTGIENIELVFSKGMEGSKADVMEFIQIVGKDCIGRLRPDVHIACDTSIYNWASYNRHVLNIVLKGRSLGTKVPIDMDSNNVVRFEEDIKDAAFVSWLSKLSVF